MQSLSDRVVAQIDLAGGDEIGRREIVQAVVARMMASPTAREIALDYLDRRIPTAIQFGQPGDSAGASPEVTPLAVQVRATTAWKDDRVVVTVNELYLTIDEELRLLDLPVVLAHELIGHGLWYARAARESVLQGYHHHELNETNARLVGWIVNFELNGLADSAAPIRYLLDPAHYVAELKLKLPYYALTFSAEEMLRPIETLEERLRQARVRHSALAAHLAGLRGRPAATDDRADAHEGPDPRTRTLTDSVRAEDVWVRTDLANLEAVIAQLEDTLGRFKAETERESETYLRWASEHSLFIELQREVGRRTLQLREFLSPHLPEREHAP